MIRRLRHPRFERLVRLVDGDLGPEETGRLREHLEGCLRCRRDVRFLRRVAELARELPRPRLPPDLWEKIEARRAAGERVILPNAPPRWEQRSPRWRWALAVSVLAGAAALALLAGSREATAGTRSSRWVSAQSGSGWEAGHGQGANRLPPFSQVKWAFDLTQRSVGQDYGMILTDLGEPAILTGRGRRMEAALPL